MCVAIFPINCQVPNLTWHDVIMKLDYPGFQLSSPEGLALIVTAYKTASRDPFPTEAIYLSWECPRGQVGEGGRGEKKSHFPIVLAYF